MFNKILETDYEEKLIYIQKIPIATDSIPHWLTIILGEIHSHHTKFRSILRENKLKWSYYEYSEHLGIHYYNLALLHYKIFYHHKINLNSVKLFIAKCFNTLQMLMNTSTVSERITDLHTSAKKLYETVNNVYADIESRAQRFKSKFEKASVLVAIGDTDDEDLNLVTPKFAKFHTKLFCIEVINFVSQIEQSFSLHSEKSHTVKHDLCNVLAEVYKLCHQSKLHEYYIDLANEQLKIHVRKTAIEDVSHLQKRKVQKLIRDTVTKYKMSIDDVKTVVIETYTNFPNNLELAFIEQKYVKYLIKNYLNELDAFIVEMNQKRSEDHFREVLLVLDKVKSLEDIPIFFRGDYYQLLNTHIPLLLKSQQRKFIKQFKLKCWNAVIPYVETAQNEVDLLKQIILYLQSTLEPRAAISKMKLQSFCKDNLSAQEFIVNILNLNESNNKDLIELKSTAYMINVQKSFFLMKKIIEVLYTYAFPAEPIVRNVNGRNIIELNGKLIIISEVYTKILHLKTSDIQELHIVGADIVHIDTDLKKNDWSSISILIVAKYIHVHGQITWDVGGHDGQQHKSPAANGKESGENGTNGIDGFAGKSGGNIHISCQRIVNSENFTLTSNGGAGGNGQAGGDGMRGEDGNCIDLYDFVPLVSPPKPNIKIRDCIHNVTTSWSKDDTFRFSFWTDGHKYIRGTTSDGQTVTYSYYAGVVSANNEQYLLFEGTPGQNGGQSGQGGFGGSGGFGGEIRIDCAQPATVNVNNKTGKSGDAGKDGESGEPGKNGSDMGSVYVNGCFTSVNEYIGSNQDSKITRKFYKRRNRDNYVECCYRKYVDEVDDYFVELDYKSNTLSVHNRNTSNRRDNKKEKYADAVRVNAISSDVIAHHEENNAEDIADILSNLQMELEAIKDHALEASIEIDEEKESEMTEFQTRRQTVFDDTKFNNTGKRLKKNAVLSQKIDTSYLIRDVNSNPTFVTSWFNLNNLYISYEDLNELFLKLNTHKNELNGKFGEIHGFLIEKYKYVICNRISEMDLSLNKTDKFVLNPVGNFLKRSAIQDFTHKDLGILNNFFRDSNKELLENLINYSEKLKPGSILYPLKFFLMERCHNDEEFKRISEDFTIELEKFHRRLERLAKCYKVAFIEDRDSAILNDIKDQKLIIENEFVIDEKFSFIITEFHEHVKQHGISSSSVRELLAYAFDCRINIFVPNEHMQLILLHEHNPTSANVLYLVLQNGGCTELVMDSDYKELVLERKNAGIYYSSVLSYVDKFVCKQQFDEFLHDLSLIDTATTHDCIDCRGNDGKQLIKLLLYCFPELSRPNIATQIRKLRKKIGNGILCALLKQVYQKKDLEKFACERKFEEFLENVSLIDINHDTITVHECVYCQEKDDTKLIQLLLRHFPLSNSTIKTKLDKFTTKYIKDKSLLCAILRRFDVEGVRVSLEELSYLVNAVLKSLVSDHTNMSIFQWILTAYPQEKWLNEIFYLELQNYFRANLQNIPNLISNIRNIPQKDILLLMETKLSNSDDTVDLKCIEKCINILGETSVNIELIEKLPLSKWPYVMREQLLEYKLSLITQWNSEELQRAMHFLIKLECNVGLDLIDKFLEIISEKKSMISSGLLIEMLIFFNSEEWSLNDELLKKLQLCDSTNIQNQLMGNMQNLHEDRSLDLLLKLIKSNSHTSPEIVKVIDTFHNHPCLIYNEIDETNLNKIEEWSKNFKNSISELQGLDKENFVRNNTNKILNMICAAIHLKREFHLRRTQRIAILLLLTHDHNTLAQISTGEGKSLIVVAAAIFKALCNEKVDVITSSSVLAKRDVNIYADIYNLFGVRVAHNCSNSFEKRKDVYSGADVIYGDLSNFQKDWLLDRFYDKNILGSRNFENLFVDEVDSMLLDKGNNTLYLSHEIPGLDKLQSVYMFIWKKVVLYTGRAVMNWEEMLTEAVLFDLYGTLSADDLKELLKVSQIEANDLFYWLVDLKVLNKKNVCLLSFSKVNDSQIPDKYKIHKDKLIYITNNILNREKEIIIPTCFYNFIETHLKLWIKNAILASTMEDGQDYVLDVDRTADQTDINPNITIIDKGTGTDQNNSQWEEALHQFLQLKYGCKISAQSLKAVFISNVSYFKKYQKLFGLTGTLGLQVERDLLQKLYNVHFVNIPTAKQKKLTEIEPILCESSFEWLFKIVDRTKELIRENRSVLVICETIKEVNDVYKAFQQKQVPNVMAYKREYEESDITQGETQLEPGHVIIATNLAGRGTDIKVDDALNNAGGVHVLLTYLASNARIELQAYGRAARSGCNGSAQLIIIGSGSVLNISLERNMHELQRIADIKILYDTRITVEEHFFDEFTKVYEELKYEPTPVLVKEIALQRSLDRWAYWLDENGKNLNENTSNSRFQSFVNEIKNTFSDWKSWKNDHVSLINLGIKYLEDKSYDTAIEIFDFVIKNEPVFSEAAHYYKAAALIMHLNFENKPFFGNDLQKIEEFILELSTALRKFENRKDACNIASAFIQNLKESLKNSFVQIDAFKSQQEYFVNMYSIFTKSIENVKGQVVCQSSFTNLEVSDIMSEEIYDDFMEFKILKKAQINHVKRDDLIDISSNYGISVDMLTTFLKQYAGKQINEDTFLEELKSNIKIPSLENFWDILLRQNKLAKETVFVIVYKAKLTQEHEDLLQNAKKLTIDIKLNNKQQVFMKRVTYIDNDSCYIFEQSIFKTAIGLKLFEHFKRQGIISINKIATVIKEKCTESLQEFDYVRPKDLTSDNISYSEATNIFKILTKNGTLKKELNNQYRFADKYDETNLKSIHVYSQSVMNVFRIRFSYKIALENMLVALKESETPVFPNLITEPHISLMWEIIEKNIIQPVTVRTINEKEITDRIVAKYGFDKKVTDSVTKHLNNVLNSMITVLDRFETPVFKLVPIEEYLEEMQSFSLQDFLACRLNGLSFILTAEEKKWTKIMVWNTGAVMVTALVQIALGLAIQLCTFAWATYPAGFFIAEGISDLIFTASCWKTGYFSWESYKHHKIQSIITTAAAMSTGAIISNAAKFTQFGSKILTKGVTVAGEEVALETGKKLIKNANLVYNAVTNKIIQKSCSDIIKGVANVAVDSAIESYLQNFCTTLSDKMLTDIGKVVQQHPVNITLEQLYHSLDPAEAQERAVLHTDKMLSYKLLLSKIRIPCQNIVDILSSGFAEAAKKAYNGKGAQFIAVLNKVLDISKYVIHLTEIANSVVSLLTNLNNQIKLNIKPNHKIDFNQSDSNDFKKNIITKWGEQLCEHTRKILANNIMKPLMDKCLHALIIRKTEIKKGQTTYNRLKIKFMKPELHEQLNDECLHPEVMQKLIYDYQESLVKLRSSTRDNNLYADLVLENGHMDSVCLRSCSNMLVKRNISSRSIKIIVEVTDSGITEEYCSHSGTGEPHVVQLKLENNHYTNINGGKSETSYDCLYHALKYDIFELETLKADEFRRIVCDNIRTDPELQHMISRGNHSFSISKQVYEGYVDKEVSTKQIHDELISGNSEYTSYGVHLSEVSDCIDTKGYIGNPVNAIMNNKGGYTFTENRRIVAASTINNPEVLVDVRIFGDDELLSQTLSKQYRDKTQQENSLNDVKNITAGPSQSAENIFEMGYGVKEKRIRNKALVDQSNYKSWKFTAIKQKFFKVTKKMVNIHKTTRGNNPKKQRARSASRAQYFC